MEVSLHGGRQRMTLMDKMLDELLVYGEGDWLQASDVASTAKWTGNAATPDEIRELSQEITREFVKRGLMIIGQLTHSGFVAWEGSLDEQMERFDRAWRALPREPTLGDVCWLQATEKGEARARELVDDESAEADSSQPVD